MQLAVLRTKYSFTVCSEGEAECVSKWSPRSGSSKVRSREAPQSAFKDDSTKIGVTGVSRLNSHLYVRFAASQASPASAATCMFALRSLRREPRQRPDV